MTLEKIINNTIELVTKYELEPSEIIYLYLLYTGDVQLLMKYCFYSVDYEGMTLRVIDGKRVMEPAKFRLSPQNIERMLEKGVIIKHGEYDEQYNMYDIEITESFKQELDKYYGERKTGYGEEMWNEYPSTAYSDTKSFPLKATAKTEFIKRYEQEIDLGEHSRVMSYLRRKKGTINYKITTFLESKPWLEEQVKKTRKSTIG